MARLSREALAHRRGSGQADSRVCWCHCGAATTRDNDGDAVPIVDAGEVGSTCLVVGIALVHSRRASARV